MGSCNLTEMKTELLSAFKFQTQSQVKANKFASTLWTLNSANEKEEITGALPSFLEGVFSLSEQNYWSLFPYMLELVLQGSERADFSSAVAQVLAPLDSQFTRNSYVSVLSLTQKEIVASVLAETFAASRALPAHDAKRLANELMMVEEKRI